MCEYIYPQTLLLNQLRVGCIHHAPLTVLLYALLSICMMLADWYSNDFYRFFKKILIKNLTFYSDSYA